MAQRLTRLSDSKQGMGNHAASTPPLTLHRCDRFVARTMNWLYDHLRFVPDVRQLVLCDALQHRDEFPELEAWCLNPHSLTRRLWRKLAGQRPYLVDVIRIKARHPRVLHSHFGYVAAEDFGLQEALGVPWVVGFYGADVYQLGLLSQWQETYMRLFERLALALALGPVMADRLQKMGCPSEKVKVHPLGVEVDTLPFRPRVLKPGEPLKLLFAGTFREKKGIQYVLEGMALAHRRGVNLHLDLVAGAMGKSEEEDTRHAVFAAIRRLGLEHVVSYSPLLPFRELLGLALNCHLFLAPSVTAANGDCEGTPFVLQQMMATGMPAIATVHSDIPFIFGDLKYLLVPERDSKAIADRLQSYAEHPEQLISDGIAMRNRLRSTFDVRRCAAELAKIYQSLMTS